MAVSGAVAQNLTIKSLELDQMDLTAAHQPVKDLNGVPCALLKVQMLDRMAKAEGDILRRVDNGTETWLYLPEGTKMVKIIGEKHKPLMVNLYECFPKGVVKKMILVNTDYISGKELEMLGLVKGSTIQSKNIGRDITQGFKTLVGGELKAYNDMMNEARALATKRMVGEAEALGADAVVNIRYASSAIMQGAAEVIAYGTAVKFAN